MTSSSRVLVLLAAGALALGLSSCAANPAPPSEGASSPAASSAAETDGACTGDEGVSVTIDAGDLAGGDEIDRASCIATKKALTAADALEEFDVDLEGTTQYGDQVICRVDGLPSASEPLGSTQDPAYVESCTGMPAAFGYWALWVKRAGGAWDYAQEGVATLSLEPGDSVELLFTLDGAPAAPTS